MRRMMSEEEQKQLFESISTLTQNIKDLEQTIIVKTADLSAKITVLKTSVNENTKEIKNLKAQVTDLNKINQNLTNEINKINVKITELEQNQRTDYYAMKSKLDDERNKQSKRNAKVRRVLVDTAVGPVEYTYHR